MNNTEKQIKVGAMLSYIAIGLNVLSTLIYSPWMLSKIGEGDYGLYTLATSLINIFLFDFGISAAVTRFTSKLVAEGKQEEVNCLLGVIYKLFIIISLVIAVVLSVVYCKVDSIYVALLPEEMVKFKVVFIIAAIYSIVSFPLSATVNGILTSYEKFIQIKLCDVLHKIIMVVLIVATLMMGFGLYALVFMTAISNLIMYIIKLIIIKKYTPVKIRIKYRDKSLLKEIFGFSIWALINAICSRLVMSLCPNILGMTAGTVAITMFSFAAVLESYTYTFASAIDGMFMPQIARITYGEKNMSKLFSLMVKVGRFQFQLVGLILLGFTVLGRDFIVLWLNEGYIDVYYGAILLILPAPFYLSQQIAKNAMVMMNNIKYLSYVNIFKAIINVILVVVFSHYFGAIGACAAICVSYTFRNIANMVLYEKKLKISMKKFIRECYFRMGSVMLITFLLGKTMSIIYSKTGWGHLIIKAVFLGISYFVLMWMIAYNENEKCVIKDSIRKLLQKGNRSE